ncbi:hypothetical protein LguiA_017690 [Lonicera macranthoides]
MLSQDSRTNLLEEEGYDMIQPSSPFNSTKEPSGFINEDSTMFMLKDWAWKFEGKVNKVLVLRAIKQWRFLKGYGMKDCKLMVATRV